MQWQIEDAMLYAVDILDADRARRDLEERFEHDSLAAAQRKVNEDLAQQRGSR